MGMFDHLRCDYPLPVRAQAQGISFQTTSLECGLLDYHLRADGTLWVEDFDIEDHSNPEAEGIARLAGMMTRVNPQWRFVSEFTGLVEFYGHYGRRQDGTFGEVELSAWMVGGKLQRVELTRESVPACVLADDQAQEIEQHTPLVGPGPGKKRL